MTNYHVDVPFSYDDCIKVVFSVCKSQHAINVCTLLQTLNSHALETTLDESAELFYEDKKFLEFNAKNDRL